jgi:recombinational DNA repair ATPase RecF
MCTGDTIFTYYQDILGTTHYDFFVGDNGTGKTNNLRLFNLLAYRNVLSSEMTAPNIYQLLGNEHTIMELLSLRKDMYKKIFSDCHSIVM